MTRRSTGLDYSSPTGSRLYALLSLERDVGRKGFLVIAMDAASGEVVWEQVHRYRDQDESGQNFPDGLVVSPDGSQVFVADTEYFYDAEDEVWTGVYLVVAYSASDGSRAWVREVEPLSRTGCRNTRPLITQWRRALATSPSGDLVYLVGVDRDPDSGCTAETAVFGPRVFAFHTSTGAIAWDEFITDEAGRACHDLWACDIGVAPGPDGGDAGSRVIVHTQFTPHGARTYPWTLAFDGRTGELGWHGRYLDTYADNGSSLSTVGAPVIGADGNSVHVLYWERSKTRGWSPGAPSLFATYDVR